MAGELEARMILEKLFSHGRSLLTPSSKKILLNFTNNSTRSTAFGVESKITVWQTAILRQLLPKYAQPKESRHTEKTPQLTCFTRGQMWHKSPGCPSHVVKKEPEQEGAQEDC